MFQNFNLTAKFKCRTFMITMNRKDTNDIFLPKDASVHAKEKHKSRACVNKLSSLNLFIYWIITSRQ